MDSLGRPYWGDFWITMAYFVSRRSLDPSTKHGCVVVKDDNTILSIGYNSPPRGCNDAEMPKTRPDKYLVMAHAEENAIVSAARNGICLKDSRFYVTGHPCASCLRQIINVGAKTIVYGNVSTHFISENDKKIMQKMLANQRLNLMPLSPQHIECSKEIIDNISKFLNQIENNL